MLAEVGGACSTDLTLQNQNVTFGAAKHAKLSLTGLHAMSAVAQALSYILL